MLRTILFLALSLLTVSLVYCGRGIRFNYQREFVVVGYADSIASYKKNLDGTLSFVHSLAGGGYSFTTVKQNKFLYVVHRLSNLVRAYLIKDDTGEFVYLNTYATGIMPEAIIADPQERFVFIPNNDSNSVYRYRIESTGELTFLGSTSTTADPVTVATKSEFLYVGTGAAIQQFRIESNGDLTSVYSFPQGVLRLILHPQQQYIYGVQNLDIESFRIESNGNLTHLNSSPGQGSLEDCVLEPLGRFIFSLDDSGGLIRRLQVGSNGLTNLGSTGFPSVLSFVYSSLSGNYLYVPDSFGVRTYRINSSGTITLIDNDDLSGIGGSERLVTDSSGNFVYVTKFGGSSGMHSFQMASDGTLNYLGSISGPSVLSPRFIKLIAKSDSQF